MVELDTILRINWLANNHSIVDFWHKNVELRTSNQKEIVYHGKAMKKKSLFYASLTWKAKKTSKEVYLEMVNKLKEESSYS